MLGKPSTKVVVLKGVLTITSTLAFHGFPERYYREECLPWHLDTPGGHLPLLMNNIPSLWQWKKGWSASDLLQYLSAFSLIGWRCPDQKLVLTHQNTIRDGHQLITLLNFIVVFPMNSLGMFPPLILDHGTTILMCLATSELRSLYKIIRRRYPIS